MPSNDRQGEYMVNFEPYYSAIYENDYYTGVGKSEQEKKIVETLINATAPDGFKSIIDKEKGTYSEFIDLVIDQIAKSVENIVEDQKLIEEVYEEIKLSLRQEQGQIILTNLTTARDVEGFPDVLVPKQDVDPKPLKPFEHQCYLLENIRAISSYKDNLVQNEKYKNIGAIFNEGNGRNNLPGNLISYINHANKQ